MKGKIGMIKTNVFYTPINDELKELVRRKEENRLLEEKLNMWNLKAEKIREQFDFFIPNYLIDEIIEREIEQNYNNLHYLCNMAYICGRISKKECDIIKKIYT